MKLSTWLIEALKRLHQDESGDMPIGPILIIALVVIPLVILILVFRDKITGWWESAVGDLESNR